MKKPFIKFFNGIVLLILGFSGITSSCLGEPTDVETVVCPGSPYAVYELKGVVTVKGTSEPIRNIRVIRKIYETTDYIYNDTVYSDAKGKYNFEFGNSPYSENVFKLKTEDIDGEENGGLFETEETDVTVTEDDRTENGEGLNQGKFVKTQNIELDKKTITLK